ncbi:hypothetical protein [Anaerovorax sp. IOR16]|uniref:hypothetical protein n=1 Tax=Anaerovorax sp. IOR16 TaxID=2773458 RepID=UPI0019D19B98|nr:hypothetical protein [Anaerovorax sp. IOR16]
MANGDIHKLGTFYMNGTKQVQPTKPWRNDSDPGGAGSAGNIPNYTSGNLEIRDTDAYDNYKIKWVEVNIGDTKLLVCDRNLVVNVQWDHLNSQNLIFGKTITIDGQQYKIRCLTGGTDRRNSSDSYAGGKLPNEWDNIIVNEGNYPGLLKPTSADLDSGPDSADKVSAHNLVWNWYGCYSWCQDTYSPNTACRAYRGFSSARYYGYGTASYDYPNLGWRPVLEVLNTAPLISDTDKDLGNYAAPLVKTYTVGEADGDDFSIFEKLDGVTIQSLSGQKDGTSFTIDLTSRWGNLTKNKHTLQVVATDINNASSTRTWTFTKTNSPPNTPTINSPSQGLRVGQSFYVEFTPRADDDGDTQSFKIEVADNSSFNTGKQTFSSGLQRYNSTTQSWENVSSCSPADVGKKFRIQVTGMDNYKTKYVRVGTTDTSGSNTTVYSSYLTVNIGDVLEFKTLPYEVDYLPMRITVKEKKSIDSRATITVKACNNGNDTSPTWEDITEEYLAEKIYQFQNTSKTADKYAVRLHFKIVANTSTGTIEVQAAGVGVS